ncbi:hypothetical protein [Oceanicella actignis]|uniref:Uncharacterized protein n=1 Tax=Oceanicella actignis TaxID=1189325 RepID=A0A1M7TY12_9RHOB|nr:hypothetical protein [Oceanicella actignis]SET81191.1 hypothetical protein SAMN04488119_11078 [Oceanicella actignis]SHN75601.1 hypothetical protein SAMN05216200_11178 [Oceanicella actignis]
MNEKQAWQAPRLTKVEVKAATQGNGKPKNPGDACGYAALGSTAKCS